jgi:hypothetical protein
MNTYHQYRDGGRPISLLMQCWAQYWSKDPAVSEEGAWAFGELLDLVETEPERAWESILYALNCMECLPHLGVLAAGPLEDLLCLHGVKFIDRIERLAVSDPRFAHVLGGVWQSQIPPEIWARVQQVRDPSFWNEKVPKG